VREVIHTAANDVWSAVSAEGETLIPALRDVIVSVDTGGKRIVTREIPGLTAPEERPAG
jgi:ribosomal 30S subunit maturation factor RimM